MADENRKGLVSHAGGLAVRGDYVYVTSNHKKKSADDGTKASRTGMYVYSKTDIMKAEENALITSLGHIDTFVSEDDYVGVSFITIDGNNLYLGEFYREQNYQTLDFHKFETPAGDFNHSLALCYEFSSDPSSVFGLNPSPVAAFSMPDLVQGMAINNGKFYLSCSYGMPFSTINIYSAEKLAAVKGEITVLGKTLPLYYFDSASLVEAKKIAPMSEEIDFHDGLMYTMCESASNKYIFGKFTSAKYCYATDMDY